MARKCARIILMAEHNNSDTLLFSHIEMGRDLLLGFAKEDWVQLDLETLEHVGSFYVSHNLRDRLV